MGDKLFTPDQGICSGQCQFLYDKIRLVHTKMKKRYLFVYIYEWMNVGKAVLNLTLINKYCYTLWTLFVMNFMEIAMQNQVELYWIESDHRMRRKISCLKIVSADDFA